MSTDKERRYGTDLDSLRARAAPRPPVEHDDPLAELERLVAENDAAIERNARAGERGHYDDRDLFADDSASSQGQPGGAYAEDPRFYAEDPYYQAQDGTHYDQDYADPDAGYQSYDDGYSEEQPPARGSKRGLFTVAAVLIIVAAGGAAALGYRLIASDDGASGPPPVINASDEPMKVAPSENANNEVPHQNKMIYDRVGEPSGGQTNIVGGAEEPVERPPSAPREVSRVILPGPHDAASDADAGADEPGPAPLPVENAAVAPEGQAGGEAVVPPEGGSRRVRTFVIRPDGSVGEGPDAPAAPQTAAAERPAGPIVGQGEAEGMSMQPGQEFGIMQSDGARSSAAEVPLPVRRPAGLQTAYAAPRAAQSAPQTTTPAVAPRPAASAAVGQGAYTVQVTSQRSEAEARQAYQALQQRFPNILGSYQPSLQPVNIADRGTFYRVRVGSFTAQADAATLCGNLKAAGGDCIIQRN